MPRCVRLAVLAGSNEIERAGRPRSQGKELGLTDPFEAAPVDMARWPFRRDRVGPPAAYSNAHVTRRRLH
jgi:hypothetical protein